MFKIKNLSELYALSVPVNKKLKKGKQTVLNASSYSSFVASLKANLFKTPTSG